MNKKVANIVVGLPLEGHFDYSIPDELRDRAQAGMRVLVSFARQKRVGIIVSFSAQSAVPRLNPLLALLDDEPVFSSTTLRLAEAFALRSGCSMGEALLLFLPAYYRDPKKTIPLGENSGSRMVRSPGAVPPGRSDPDQELIWDRSRSGVWEVLRPTVADTLASGKGMICAVPDNTYLDVVIPHLREMGADPVVLSQGTPREEGQSWDALRTGRAQIAVGFISAVLAPVRDLGLIIIFEEDSPFYKHDQSPFYHAREVAFLRSRLEGCRLRLVTSSPSLESWHDITEGRMRWRMIDAVLPSVKFLDLRNFKMKKGSFLSLGLRHHLEWVARENRKVLLYIQAARGVSDVVAEVQAAFPYLSVAGYDKMSGDLPAGAQVLVATQVIFRYQHRVQFDIAVVLDVDWEFHKTDYRAAQGVFALTQHLRRMTKEFVLLQTRHVENEQLLLVADEDVSKFYNKELTLRREMGLPPFGFLVALVTRSSDPQLACDEAKRLYDILASRQPEGIDLHEPKQDRSAIVRGKFRWCVMVQGKSLKTLMCWIKEIKRSFRGKRDTVLTVNVNP